jgi:hypothetical protein
VTATVRPGANLTNIDVWDGPNRVARFGGIKLFGEHRFKLDTNTTHTLSPSFEAFGGIELAVHITFSQNQKRVNRVAGAQNMRKS